MTHPRIKVVYLAGGYPTEDNPSHGIFNQRAAIALKEHVDLIVIQYRIYKPGRKLREMIEEDGFTRIILCVPFLPVLEKKLYYLNNRIFYVFTKIFVHSILRTADIVHASDGTLSVFASWLKKHYSFKMLAQFIGGDLNQDIVRFYKKNWMRKWKSSLNAVSFNSIALQERFRELFGDHHVSRVIYRGVDPKKFSPAETPVNNLVFYFLGGLPNYTTFTHGRNTKGGLNLMQAWSRLDGEIDGDKIKLLFAGPDSDIGLVKEWRSKLKDAQRVEIVGKINPAVIADFHRSGNIALVPSLEEGLPNAAMEAASTGNLIIANNVGGIGEIITSKINGILCDTPDADGLYKKMKWVVDNPQEITIIGNAARRNMELNFSSIDFGKKYFEYYQQILQQ